MEHALAYGAACLLVGYALGYLTVPLLDKWRGARAKGAAQRKRVATRRANAAAKRAGTPF